MQASPRSVLPPELWMRVMEHLTIEDRLNMREVSRQFRPFGSSESITVATTLPDGSAACSLLRFLRQQQLNPKASLILAINCSQSDNEKAWDEGLPAGRCGLPEPGAPELCDSL